MSDEQNNLPKDDESARQTSTSGYKNFNQYPSEASGEPTVQDAQPTPAQGAYFYGQQPAAGGCSNTYGVLSIVLGSAGCCFYGIPSVVGLILAIIGLVKKKGDPMCLTGLVVSALVVIYWIYSIVYIINNPEIMQQALQESMDLLNRM